MCHNNIHGFLKSINIMANSKKLLWKTKLNELAILFGILNSDDFELINHIILIAKETIYKCRNINLKPSLKLFISRLRHIPGMKLRKFIAQGKGASEIERHICKWNKLDWTGCTFAVGGHVTTATLIQSAMTKWHPEMERAGWY